MATTYGLVHGSFAAGAGTQCTGVAIVTVGKLDRSPFLLPELSVTRVFTSERVKAAEKARGIKLISHADLR